MRYSPCVALLALLGGAPAWGGDSLQTPELTLFPQYQAQVVLADNGAPSGEAAVDPNERAFSEFRPPLFSANKLHKYLGIGSITLATLALISPKDDEGAHAAFGAGAAALGGAAVVSGLIVHGDDVGFSQGISDPDNLHAIFATLGAAGFIAAAGVGGEEKDEDEDGGEGDEGSRYHATLGIAGYTSMLIGIRIAW